jgi:GT2 family glycosyltransferase
MNDRDASFWPELTLLRQAHLVFAQREHELVERLEQAELESRQQLAQANAVRLQYGETQQALAVSRAEAAAAAELRARAERERDAAVAMRMSLQEQLELAQAEVARLLAARAQDATTAASRWVEREAVWMQALNDRSALARADEARLGARIESLEAELQRRHELSEEERARVQRERSASEAAWSARLQCSEDALAALTESSAAVRASLTAQLEDRADRLQQQDKRLQMADASVHELRRSLLDAEDARRLAQAQLEMHQQQVERLATALRDERKSAATSLEDLSSQRGTALSLLNHARMQVLRERKRSELDKAALQARLETASGALAAARSEASVRHEAWTQHLDGVLRSWIECMQHCASLEEPQAAPTVDAPPAPPGASAPMPTAMNTASNSTSPPHAPSMPSTAAELLALHDESFVRTAYRCVLGREPDPDGFDSYLRLVRDGTDKAVLLAALADSDEGRRAAATLTGLDEVRARLRERPGMLTRLASRLARLGAQATLPTLRAIENGIFRVREEAERGLAQLEETIARSQSSLIADLGRWQQQQQQALEEALAGLRQQEGERRRRWSEVSRRMEASLAHALADLAASRPAGSPAPPPAAQPAPAIDDDMPIPLVLEFDYARTCSPSDLGLSDDSRQIAVGFRTIELIDADAGTPLCLLDMRQGANAPRSVLFGFANHEEWGTWSLGGRSALAVWLPAPPAGALLVRLETCIFEPAFDAVDFRVQTNYGHSAKVRLARGIEQIDIVLERPASALTSVLGMLRAVPDPHNVTHAEARPLVSVVILNYNKPTLSVLSSLAVVASAPRVPYEILIVDNGSRSDAWETLERTNRVARLVRISVNRFFGEGNNIGAEQARGEYLLFLNNDAFVAHGCIDELLAAFAEVPDCGAVSPVFVYPDGRLQEAGSLLLPDGSAWQRGKGPRPFSLSGIQRFDPVDYGSAACVLMRADSFRRVGGFNYRYDPAYYEDSDLGMRLLLVGERAMVARDARCTHIENATTADGEYSVGTNRAVEDNKVTFLSTWAKYLASRAPGDLPHHVLPLWPTRRVEADPITQATYSPYPLTPGGGERYLLSTAMTLGSFGPAAFTTPDRYSQLRLDNLLSDLGLQTGSIVAEPWDNGSPRVLERLVVMGNEVLPRRPPQARMPYFHCQFPFPWPEATTQEIADGLAWLGSYRKVIVNSEFTRRAFLQALADHPASATVEVVYPPVGTSHLLRESPRRKPQILNIGRFTDRGHNKHQDVLIAAMKAAPAWFRREWKLVLAGTVPNDPAAKLYFDALRGAVGSDIEVEFVLAPSRQRLDELLLESAVYAHATGYGVRDERDYWRCEHFGITIVESIAAGCLPLCYAKGGGPEIQAAIGCGATFGSVEELAALFAAATTDELPMAQRRRADELFSDAAFARRMTAALA